MADAGGELVYEVNLEVAAAIAPAYRAWLDAHVREMTVLPGFLGAQVYEVGEPRADGALSLCVHYRLRDAAALEEYLRGHAPRMRADGVARFGDGFSATRRILRPAR